MEVVIGRTRKFWKEVRYFEIIEPYSHNIAISWIIFLHLRYFFDRGSIWVYLYRYYSMLACFIYR